MSDTTPPGPDGRDPVVNEVPMARPVFPPVEAAGDTLPYARAIEHPSPLIAPVSRGRAVLEIVFVAPLVIVMSVAAAFLAPLLPIPDPRWEHVITGGGMGLGAILGVTIILKWDRQAPAAIGLTLRDLITNIALGLVSLGMFYLMATTVGMILFLMFPDFMSQQPESVEVIRDVFPPMNLPTVLLLTGFVALWEEIFFRGFLLTRLHVLLRRWWLVIPAGAVLFSLGHMYQGSLAVVMTGVLGVILGTLFVWRKSLVPGIVFHLAQNALVIQMIQWLWGSGPEG